MFTKSVIDIVAAALAFSSVAVAAPASAPQLSKSAQLQLADTATDRYSILTKDKDFVYDFTNAPFPLANRKFFPALTGTGLAIAPAVFPACSIASLHIHPRSSEIFYVVSGSVITRMIPETGARVVKNTLTANQTTIFPQGSLHMQMNTECEPAVIVAAFSSDDPGATLVIPAVFSLDDELVLDSFVGSLSKEDLDKIRTVIPRGPLFEVEECKKKCNV
ncbi:RmlC-like cupin domain containing protein [Rhypophila sp. PSN 637]